MPEQCDLTIYTGSELAAMDFSDPAEPRVDLVNCVIEFPASPHYFVELDRANSHAAILEWVAHLAEKAWVTPRHLRKFIVLACAHHKITLWNGV